MDVHPPNMGGFISFDLSIIGLVWEKSKPENPHIFWRNKNMVSGQDVSLNQPIESMFSHVFIYGRV